jgi:hypothetical protein
MGGATDTIAATKMLFTLLLLGGKLGLITYMSSLFGH